MNPELEVAQQLLEQAKQAAAQTDRAIAQTATAISLAQEAMAECRKWQERAIAAEDAYKNMREWAEKNGVDTVCRGTQD